MSDETTSGQAFEEKRLNKEFSQQDLEKEELLYKIKKLDKECKNLDYQLSNEYKRFEKFKIISGLGGVISAFIAIMTVAISLYQWNENAKQNQRAKIEDRLNHALELLGDLSPQKRLGGVVSLRSFIKEGDKLKNSQALLSLTNALALEDDPTIRNAIIEVFRSPGIQVIDSTVLKEALTSLINASRALVQEGSLRNINYRIKGKVRLDSSMWSRAKSISAIIIELLRKGVHSNDLSGIYCERCNFMNLSISNIDFHSAILTGSKFSKSKLANANFDGAILKYADFSDALCIGCSFKDANLTTTKFMRAILRESNFTVSKYDDKRNWASNWASSYVTKELSSDTAYLTQRRYKDDIPLIFQGPIFDSADLREANFNGFPLIGIMIKHHQNFLRLVSLHGANIENTDFGEIGVCGFTDSNTDPFADNTPFGRIEKTYYSNLHYGPLSYVEWHLNDKSSSSNEIGNYNISIQDYDNPFSNCNWKKAKFPDMIKFFLRVENRFR